MREIGFWESLKGEDQAECADYLADVVVIINRQLEWENHADVFWDLFRFFREKNNSFINYAIYSWAGRGKVDVFFYFPKALQVKYPAGDFMTVQF